MATRHCLALDLHDDPETIAAYRRWHAPGGPPAAVTESIRRAGILDMEVFDRLMPTPNQLDKRLTDLTITQARMLELHDGQRTEAGVRENIRVGVRYTQAWIEGRGAVPLYNLMEDAATAEICRTQLWQWIRLSADLADGRQMSSQLFVSLLTEEMADLRRDFPSPRLEDAALLFSRMRQCWLVKVAACSPQPESRRKAPSWPEARAWSAVIPAGASQSGQTNRASAGQ